MSTRSLTFVHTGNLKSPVLICMYRQSDGYFDGHGQELKTFLETITIVNGIGLIDCDKVANGMGCLAGQLVSHFKSNDVGGIYLYPINTYDCGEEYVYHIYLDGDYINDTKNCKLRLTGENLHTGETRNFLGDDNKKFKRFSKNKIIGGADSSSEIDSLLKTWQGRVDEYKKQAAMYRNVPAITESRICEALAGDTKTCIAELKQAINC